MPSVTYFLHSSESNVSPAQPKQFIVRSSLPTSSSASSKNRINHILAKSAKQPYRQLTSRANQESQGAERPIPLTMSGQSPFRRKITGCEMFRPTTSSERHFCHESRGSGVWKLLRCFSRSLWGLPCYLGATARLSCLPLPRRPKGSSGNMSIGACSLLWLSMRMSLT